MRNNREERKRRGYAGERRSQEKRTGMVCVGCVYFFFFFLGHILAVYVEPAHASL